MGAHDYIVTIEGNEHQVREKWEQIVEEDSYESGSGAYAGNATTMHGRITFYDRRLADQNEAREFCLDKHEKWSGPVAVSFHLPSEPTEADKKRIIKLHQKMIEAETKRLETLQKILAAFVNRKSKLVACKGCESRLSHEHVVKTCRKGSIWNGSSGGVTTFGYTTEPTFPTCPLCKTSLLSETDQQRIKALSEKGEKARKDHSEALKPKASKKLAWAVGGWAAS